MKQSPELQVLSNLESSSVQRASTKRNRIAVTASLLLAGIAVAYLILQQPSELPNLKRNDEEFKTSSRRPPSFVRDEGLASVEPLVVNIPPPPHLDMGNGPVAKSDPVSVDDFPARFKSKLIELDRANVDSTVGGFGIDQTRAVDQSDVNGIFLKNVSNAQVEVARATKLARTDALVAQGTLIPGVLETSIESDLPGQVRAITSDDVYSFDGRRVLIPAGTRLIGEYQSETLTGQKRVFVVWTRLLRHDGVSIRLNSIGTDSLGHSGLTGKVDTKWSERFGTSIMLSIVGGGSSYLAGLGSDNLSASRNTSFKAEQLARQNIAESFSQMANTALIDNLHIKPSINVQQGERIFIFVRQDLDFSSLYDDPVSEAIKEIKRDYRRK